MNDAVQTALDWLAIPEVRAALVVLVALLGARVVDLVLCRLLRRLAAHTHTDVDDRLIELLHRPIFVSVVLLGLYLAAEILQLPGPFDLVTVRVIATLATLIWTTTLLRICTLLLLGFSRLADRVAWLDARTVPLFDNLAKIVIVGGALYMLLLVWNLDVKPWLASAGIVGVAVGFAAKDSLANLFGGLFIIVDAPYKLGDFINLDAGERGQVTKIGLRSTRILTRDDVEITIPNAQIANSKIINESGGRWIKSRVRIHAAVAYGSDVEQVRQVLMRAATSVDHVLDEPEPRVRFVQMGDSALVFQVQCWIDEPALRGRCVDGLNTAVYNRLNEAGISIPFPQRDVHLFQAERS